MEGELMSGFEESYAKNTFYIDGDYVGDASNGGIDTPFKSFAAAFTVIDADTSLAEQDRLITIIVNGGIYNEAVTVPAYRNIRLFSKGTVIIGSGDLANYNSTTSRDFTWNFNSDSETNRRRPQLIIGTLNTDPESTSTHLAYANGWIISGDFLLPIDAGVSPGGGGTKELILNNVKVQGDFTQTTGNGQLNLYMRNCYFDNTLTASSANILNAEHCEFDGRITAATYCRFSLCELNGGATIGAYSELVPPGGFFNTKITAGTYVIAEYRLDQYTKNNLDAGSGTITGSETIIDERTAFTSLNVNTINTNPTPNDLTVNCGTDKTIVLQEPVWEDLRIGSGKFEFGGATDPTLSDWQPGASGATFKVYKFQENDEAFFFAQIPHSYKEGTDILAHVHWTPGDRGAAESGTTVAWKMDISWANIGAAFPSSTNYDLSDTCTGTDDLHEISPEVTISGTGKTVSSMLSCRIYRDTTGDTWVGTSAAQSPAGLEVDFHYQVNTLGSRTSTAK